MSQLISKTDLVVEGTVYETHLLKVGDDSWQLEQATNDVGPMTHGRETVVLDTQQAIQIAKSILRNEGYAVG